ncbi:MAG: nucleotidyltransferase domain-containing protein [Candidatus Bathyarchaeia archaeon]|nr:nucleotidyltransferase domain-containing protein [Candidatus Bathyarchaeia archaeon]
MKLKSELESNLSKLVEVIACVEGVVAIILFGSRARGNYDKYSDYDLLVIFQHEETMWENRRTLFENVAKLGLFTQVLTRSIKEFMEKTEPTFRRNILEQGTLLYLRHPFKAPAFSQNLRQMAIVKYKLNRLSQNEKMKVIYHLFGKQYRKGMVQQGGGIKLGNGCFMIPIENLENVTQILKQYNIQPKITKVYMNSLRKLLASAT